MASHLVLIGVPRELHIPYFAMGVPRSREDRIERLELGTDLARLVRRRCAAWIEARTERDRINLKYSLTVAEIDKKSHFDA